MSLFPLSVYNNDVFPFKKRVQPILINPAYHKLHLKNQDLPVYELFFLPAPSKPSKSIFAGCFANAEHILPRPLSILRIIHGV